jgi:hypothetical protein
MEVVPGWRLPSSVAFHKKRNSVVAFPGPDFPNPRKWKTPPHVELANIDYSEGSYVEQVGARKASLEAWLGKKPFDKTLHDRGRYSGHRPTRNTVLDFIGTYGVLFDASSRADGVCEVSVRKFRDLQERLREAWRRNDAKALWFPRGGEELDNFEVPFTWRGDLALRPADLWTYMRLLLTRDLATGHAKVCKWPRCAAPFCVMRRTDGESCSHECAVKFTNWKNSLKRKRGRR